MYAAGPSPGGTAMREAAGHVSDIQRTPAGGTAAAHGSPAASSMVGGTGRVSSAGESGSADAMQALLAQHQRAIFDTRGPHEPVLRHLLPCVNALLQHGLAQERRIQQLEQALAFATGVDAKVDRATAAGEEMKEAVRRVSFLWAAQGLGDFPLDDFESGANALQHGTGTPTAAAGKPADQSFGLGGVSAAQASQQRAARGPTEPTLKNPAAASLPGNQQFDAARSALQQSLETQRLLLTREQRGPATPASDAHQRLQSVEGVVDGVLGLCRQLHSQVAKMADAQARYERFSLSLEARVNVASATLQRVTEEDAVARDSASRAVDLCVRRCEALANSVSEHRRTVEEVGTRCDAAAKLAAEVRSTMPDFNTVKAVAAREAHLQAARNSHVRHGANLAYSAPPHAEGSPSGSPARGGDVDASDAGGGALLSSDPVALALLKLLDVDPRTAAAAVGDAARPPATSAQEARQRQDALAAVHEGLPFRTVLGALHRVHADVRALQGQLQQAEAALQHRAHASDTHATADAALRSATEAATEVAALTTAAPAPIKPTTLRAPSRDGPTAVDDASPAPPRAVPPPALPPLGLELKDPSPGVADAAQGPVVVRVLPKPMPAAAANLLPGDTIVGVAGRVVRDRAGFAEALSSAWHGALQSQPADAPSTTPVAIGLDERRPGTAGRTALVLKIRTDALP